MGPLIEDMGGLPDRPPVISELLVCGRSLGVLVTISTKLSSVAGSLEM